VGVVGGQTAAVSYIWSVPRPGTWAAGSPGQHSFTGSFSKEVLW